MRTSRTMLVGLVPVLVAFGAGCAPPAPAPTGTEPGAAAAAAAPAGERPRWLTANAARDGPAPRLLRVLLTNDDGWDAPGLAAVRAALVRAGHEVTVVAPAGDRSGTSAALTIGGELTVTRPTGDPAVLAVSGSPADSTLFGLTSVFRDRRPDLVVSGANVGANVGLLANHSGTVGAALTGTESGVPSIAVSTDVPTDRPPTPADFAGTGELIARVVAELARGRDGGQLLPPGMLLNINCPKADPARPVPTARYVATAPDLAIGLEYRPGADPARYTVGVGRPARAPGPDGDVAVVAGGEAAVTELRADRSANGVLPSVAADLVARLGP